MSGFKMILLVIIGILFQSCNYDKEAIIDPSIGMCDTSNITYLSRVLPIISNNCLSCHKESSNATLGGSVNLEGYYNLHIQVSNGQLVKVIEHQNGVSPMPKNTFKLSDCNIIIIKKWIEAGAPNN